MIDHPPHWLPAYLVQTETKLIEPNYFVLKYCFIVSLTVNDTPAAMGPIGGFQYSVLDKRNMLAILQQQNLIPFSQFMESPLYNPAIPSVLAMVERACQVDLYRALEAKIPSSPTAP